MKSIDKMSDNELRAEVRVLRIENECLSDAGNHLLKAGCDKDNQIFSLLACNELFKAVLDAAQVPRHDYCGTDDWFIALDKAVYEATADFGERYRDKYAKPEPREFWVCPQKTKYHGDGWGKDYPCVDHEPHNKTYIKVREVL